MTVPVRTSPHWRESVHVMTALTNGTILAPERATIAMNVPERTTRTNSTAQTPERAMTTTGPKIMR